MSILSRSLSLFSPPQFLSMPSTGVDISDTSMKYVAFELSLRPQAKKKLKYWGDITIPSGALSSGAVTDVKQLSSVLSEFKAKTGSEFVRVSLPEERAYLFETEIKRDVPLDEIRNTLEFRLEENVPIPPRDVFFDYEVMPHHSDERLARVVVAAYARDTILSYHEACVSAGLMPISFEVEAQAMAAAVVPTGQKGTVMIVDFGKTRTSVGIVSSGVLMYTATVDIGGANLSQAMRKVMGDVAEAELTTIKNTQGLIRQVSDSHIYDALISTVSVIKDEIASKMQYWHLKEAAHQSRRIQTIVLCGGSTNLKGLPEYLNETLGVPCVRADVWTNVYQDKDEVPPIEKHFSYGFATAIGLALQQAA